MNINNKTVEPENTIVVEGNKPKILLSEQAQKVGGVSIEEGISLAKQYARKLIELKNMHKSKRKGYVTLEEFNKFIDNLNI